MFLLNNIYNRAYSKLYPDIPRVVFDISDEQLKNVKNQPWRDIQPASIVCVINSSRKVSTFHRIEATLKAKPASDEPEQHLITGAVVAKLDPFDMTALLSRFQINHKYLPKNRFSIGFNVADLGTALDALEVETKQGRRPLGSL